MVYRVRVRRGGRKKPVSKGIVYGKPKSQGVTKLKFQRNLRAVAEERAGRKLAGLRVLNSYWVNQVRARKRLWRHQKNATKVNWQEGARAWKYLPACCWLWTVGKLLLHGAYSSCMSLAHWAVCNAL